MKGWEVNQAWVVNPTLLLAGDHSEPCSVHSKDFQVPAGIYSSPVGNTFC